MLYTITHKLGGNSGNEAANQLTNQLIQLQQRKPNALSAALAPLWQSVAAAEDQNQQLSKEELFKYSQQAFQVDQEIHNKLLEEVKEEKVRCI